MGRKKGGKNKNKKNYQVVGNATLVFGCILIIIRTQ
jgi:hypothetical protein